MLAACLAVAFGTSHPPQDDPKMLGNPVGIDLLGLRFFSKFLQKSSYCSFEIATKICFAWFDLVCQHAFEKPSPITVT